MTDTRLGMKLSRSLTRVSLLALTLLVVAVPSASAATKYRGVMLHSLWGESSNEDMDHELDMAKAAGSNVVRVDIAWSSLETGGKGAMSDWYVEKLDRFVEGANSRGIKVLANLWSTPCWASSAPESDKQGCDGSWWDRGVTAWAPTNAADFGNIAKWVTSRYGAKLAALEVWNEPNHPSGQFFKANGDKAAAYATIAKGAYGPAKEGNGSLPVITGSLSGTDKNFLKGMYANGIKPVSDGIAVHPYNDGRGFPGLVDFHNEMLANGDNDPVWVTEFGWPTGADPQWHVSDTEQAAFIRNAYADLGVLPWVELAALYNLRNKGSNAGSMEDNFGLVRRDFSPKAGYDGLTDGLNGRGATAVRAGGGAAGDAGNETVNKGVAADATNADAAATARANANAKRVKLRVALSAPGKRTLSASGQLVGQPKGVVTLTVMRKTPSGRFVKFASKTVQVKKGRFRANVSRYKKGRYQLKAVLKGTKTSSKTREAGLGADGEAGTPDDVLPEGVVQDGQVGASTDAGDGAGAVVVAPDFGANVSPGPLRTGGLIDQSEGDRTEIELVQRRLNSSGYDVKVTGSYDSATEAAVRRFQTDSGLLVDGIVGRQTMASLLA